MTDRHALPRAAGSIRLIGVKKNHRLSRWVAFCFIVRRIGMTKPPVKLGVGKKFLEKRKEPPSDRMKLVWQPQHFNIGGSMSMNDVKSL